MIPQRNQAGRTKLAETILHRGKTYSRNLTAQSIQRKNPSKLDEK